MTPAEIQNIIDQAFHRPDKLIEETASQMATPHNDNTSLAKAIASSIREGVYLEDIAPSLNDENIREASRIIATAWANELACSELTQQLADISPDTSDSCKLHIGGTTVSLDPGEGARFLILAAMALPAGREYERHLLSKRAQKLMDIGRNQNRYDEDPFPWNHLHVASEYREWHDQFVQELDELEKHNPVILDEFLLSQPSYPWWIEALEDNPVYTSPTPEVAFPYEDSATSNHRQRVTSRLIHLHLERASQSAESWRELWKSYDNDYLAWGMLTWKERTRYLTLAAGEEVLNKERWNISRWMGLCLLEIAR